MTRAHRQGLWGLIFLGLVNLASAQSPNSALNLPNQGLAIIQRFGGPAKMIVSADMESKEPAPMIIQSQADFEKLVALLPAYEQPKAATPVPNRDPLLQNPRFDWSRYMLLVVFDSQSLSFPPNVGRAEITDSGLKVYVEYPDTKNLIEAKPPEMGAYGAALLTKSSLPIQWINPGHRNTEAQRQSMMMFLPQTNSGGE